MIKTVIFDIDNTLYNYDENHIHGMNALAAYCAEHFGISYEKMYSCYKQAEKSMNERIGSDTAAIHSRMLRFQCMAELLSQPLFPHVKNMYHAYWDTLITNSVPTPGSLEFIKKLKNNDIRVGIGTDMTAYIQYKKLEKLGFAPYIDFIVTSEEAGVEKPHPHFFSVCVEKSGCLSEECAFIGDNLKKDVQGACENGLKGIWYSQEKIPENKVSFSTIISFCDLISSDCEIIPMK